MSTGVLSPPTVPTPPPRPFQPRPKRWTCDEFHQLGDSGAFEGQSLILIDGEILEMPVANPPHATSKSLTEAALRAAFGTGFVVRTENPLILGQTTDPVPDIAVVTGSIRDFAQSHPTTAALVVEVSDSSLDYDTTDKASLYASAGISDYWVVDLVNRRLVVFRDPRPDASKPFGATYGNVTAFVPGQSVAALAAPGAMIAIADLLP